MKISMEKADYFKIIHKYFKKDSLIYQVFLIHSILVCAKAITIAKNFKMSPQRLRFIEEAAMLHDLGIFKVLNDDMTLKKGQHYISHIVCGKEMLEKEGLPKHARVALSHIGTGISKEEIIKKKLPLPKRDIFPETKEEKIISYADLFFSKTFKNLWQEKTFEEVAKEFLHYGERSVQTFKGWRKELEGK